MNKQEEKSIGKIIKDFFESLGIDGDYEVSFAEDELEVVLDTKDNGIVIGYHGEVLEALQLLVSLAISKKIGRFIRVSIEVGDYKKSRTEYLKNLAMQTKEKVLAERREYALENLRSWERRVIHMLLQEDEDVLSESTGEGKERILIVKPR